MIISIVVSLVIGAVCGWLITSLMNMDSSNIVFNCGLGIVGSIVGGFLAGIIGFSANSLLAEVILSVIGGCAVVWAYHKFTGK